MKTINKKLVSGALSKKDKEYIIRKN